MGSGSRPDTPTYPRAYPRYKQRYSTDSAEARLLAAKTGVLSFDLETRGLHPHARKDAQVGAIIVKTGGKRFIFREYPDWWDEVMEDKDCQKIGSNLKFDFMWNIHATRLPAARNVQDLMIKSQLTNRYRTPDGARKAGLSHLWEPNDLKSILKRNLDVDIKKEIHHEDVWRYETSWEKYIDDETGKERRRQVKTPVELLHKGVDWAGPWSDKMVEYMLEDIDYLEPANQELDKKLREQGQERVAWIEGNAVFATAWMTYNGILPDVNEWSALLTRQRTQYKHLMWHAHKVFPDVANFRSNPQVKAAMSNHVGSQIRNIRKETIKQLAPYYRGAAVYRDVSSLQTRLKNWGEEFLRKYVCMICQRFHPDWRQIGAETCRYSCSSPNMQQIPREVDYRRLFISPPGFKLASLDYSAIEVVCAAVFAQCKSLMEACRTGNPHGAKAAQAMGLTYEDWLKLDDAVKKDSRQMGKIVNFGMLFGGGAVGLMTQARDLFNHIMTEEQARNEINIHYTQYPELKWTRNLAYRAMQTPGPVEVRNLVGLRRWLEGMNRKPTSWLNTIIQSTAGHGIKSAFRYLMECGLLPYLCLQVHDELLFEFPDLVPETRETPEMLAEVAYDCMMKGMQEVLGTEAPIKIEWEDTIGTYWK